MAWNRARRGTARRAGAPPYDPAVSASPITRERSDLCPGALRPFQATDGLIGRVRKPGGLLAAADLRLLAAASLDLGDGRLELTSRGNLQVRALTPDGAREFARRAAAAGLLPSATHERVRNILASPLAGIDAPTDLRSLVDALDAELCARPVLAGLSGRFLFALDDGRGDVARIGADVTVIVAEGRAQVETLDVPVDRAAQAAAAVAEAFLAEREATGSQAWRMRELGEGATAVFERARAALAAAAVEVREASRHLPPAPPEPVGLIAQADGGTSLCVLAPFGRLSAAQALLLADHAGQNGLRVTPWRSVVVPDVTDAPALVASAAAAGLGVDAGSPWYRVSACGGLPGCAKSHADVRADALVALDRWPGRRVHWSGCERRCGRPATAHVDVLATGSGYLISE